MKDGGEEELACPQQQGRQVTQADRVCQLEERQGREVILVAAPRATVGATAQVEWTGQGLSVAQTADTRQEGEAHQRQAEPQTGVPREPAGRRSPRVPASPSLPDSRKKNHRH